MLACGIPLVQALDALSSQPEHEGFERVLTEVTRKVSTGHAFSAVLPGYPRIFSRVFVTMVQVGEETGTLTVSLKRVAEWLERDEQIRRKAKASLSYPVFVLGLCLLLSLIVIYTVLPTFCTIFREMQTELPLITRVVMALTDLLQAPWVWLLTGLVGFFLHRRFQSLMARPSGAAWVYRVLKHIPLVGSILQHGTIARYCSAAGPLVASGMNLPRALRLAAGASGNPLLIQDADALVKTITEGATPTEHMAAHPDIYSPTLCHMLAAGEEASNSGDMYDRAGHFHQLEMESSVELLGAALEPLLLIFVSIAVALLILAIFLPLYGSLSQFG